MKKLMSFCLLGMMTASCVTNKQQAEITPYSLERDGEAKILSECNVIKETGDIFKLLAQIKNDTKSVIQILEQRPYRGMEDTIQDYASEIKLNSDLVIKLSKEEWNHPEVRHSIKWVLDESDFSRNQYVFYPVITKVYFQGMERPDLIKKITIDQDGSNFVVEYLNAGTMLEFCQLNETLMLVLEVKTGSFKKPKIKNFNLHVNLEK